MAEGQRWYVALAGKTHGPFPEEEVARRLQAGEIGPASLVCPEGGSKWIPLSACLAHLAGPSAPPEEPTPAPRDIPVVRAVEVPEAAPVEVAEEPSLRGTIVHIEDRFGADVYELKVTHTMVTYSCERTTGCLWVIGLPLAVILPPIALVYVFWHLVGGHREASLLLRNLDSLEVRKQPRWNYVIYGWLLLGLLAVAFLFSGGARDLLRDRDSDIPRLTAALAAACGVIFTILLICRRRIELVGTSFNNVFVYQSDRSYDEMRKLRDRIWKAKLEGL
jgi:hypothetical protein